MTQAVFAIPGDKDRRTGGFIYEAKVLNVLNDIGVSTEHLELPNRFPDPTTDDMTTTLAALRAVPQEQAIILDGLVFGAIDPEGLANVNAPVIAMIHHPLGLETGLAADRAKFLLQNEAAALKHAAHVIVPSPHTAQVLIQDFGADQTRISVALPGFERPVLDKTACNPPLILSVGLLAKRKGHDIFLKALSLIEDLPWQAAIVGKAHDEAFAATLRNQAERLGLTSRVNFAGEVDPVTLASYFNTAHIFALATRYEGYGMVLSEAMLYGLPVISCRVGAVPETVGDAGLLSSPDHPEGFAEGLRMLLEHPDVADKYAALSYDRGQTLPTWKMTAGIFETVIRQVKSVL